MVEGSGNGWDHFAVRTVGAVGQLYPIKVLDYENPKHRDGFTFMVQVTDQVSTKKTKALFIKLKSRANESLLHIHLGLLLPGDLWERGTKEGRRKEGTVLRVIVDYFLFYLFVCGSGIVMPLTTSKNTFAMLIYSMRVN